VVGVNDLASLRPQLAAEWHPTRNGARTAATVPVSSGKTAWWLCAAGHEWEAIIANRSKGVGCDKCGRKGTSRIESALFRALDPYLTDATSGGRIPLIWSTMQKKASVDITGSHRGRLVAVEYDGEYFHSGPDKVTLDLSKTAALLAAGYLVVRVREDKLPSLEVDHPDLFQIGYKYRIGSDKQLDGFIAPVAAAICQWLEQAV
jgi:hypothetical protein